VERFGSKPSSMKALRLRRIGELGSNWLVPWCLEKNLGHLSLTFRPQSPWDVDFHVENGFLTLLSARERSERGELKINGHFENFRPDAHSGECVYHH
jgi:hypothetical protein